MTKAESLYRVIDRKKVYQAVVDQITDLILQDHLQPGDQLPPERDLAEELGVSRNAVREATKALEERGLVEVRQGAGTFVRCLSPETVSDSLSLYLQTNTIRYLQLMELREIIDVEIVGRLAQNVNEQDVHRLVARITRMEQLLGSPQEFAKEDAAFHMDLYRAANNELLLIIMQPLMDLLVETMTASFQMPGSAESSLARHRQLVECIAGRDAEGARRVISEILARGKLRLHGES